jgi:hypothetical protein
VGELDWCILKPAEVAMMYPKGEFINDIIPAPEDGERSS